MTFSIYSAKLSDKSGLLKLSTKYQMMNLPAHSDLLEKKIETSQLSFKGVLPKEERNFLFILKNTNKEIIGASQLAVKSGTKKNPNYSLQIIKHSKTPYLQLKKNTDGPSYLGGLLLDKSYRGHSQKLGRQISLIRLLFTAMHSSLFEEQLHAEIAPWLDKEGNNPFFTHFIKNFFSLSVKEIDHLTLTNKKKLFSQFPRHKILLSSLPQIVQNTLGRAGKESLPAEKLLKDQGFQFISEVDPFDGGPYLQGKINDIPLVQSAKKVALSQTGEYSSEKESPAETNQIYLWAKTDPDKTFKGGALRGLLKDDIFFISKKDFLVFDLKPGDAIFITKLYVKN